MMKTAYFEKKQNKKNPNHSFMKFLRKASY